MAPSSIGKYQISHPLGRGGMAEVYAGLHPALERQVAIKVVLPQYASSADLEARFYHEARLVASLRHPHIVLVYDFDVADDRLFMVMEYLDGGTLRERSQRSLARRQLMPLADVARILTALADALDYAHRRGAVHRDIKPANILFTAQDEPVLTDFGIAKLLDESVQLTAAGSVVGSPAYMAPEQAVGAPVDGRSDQYALGVVVYELVTGRTPFQGGSPAAVMSQHYTTPPPPPHTLNPNLPAAVEAVLLKTLAKDPAARYATAGAFARAFRQALPAETAAPAADAPSDPTQDQTLAAAPTPSRRAASPAELSQAQTVANIPTVATTDQAATAADAPAAPRSAAAEIAPTAPYPQPGTPPPHRSAASPAGLIGRKAELAALHSYWQAACQQQGHTVFVTGEAGLGKSTLIDAFVCQLMAAPTQLQVARGACSQQFGREEAFLPFAETLTSLLEEQAQHQETALSRRDLVQDSAPAWMSMVAVTGSALSGLLSEARARRQGPPGIEGATQDERSQLMRQYTNALLALADQAPVLLFLDDVHWADAATVSLLVYLARQIQHHPVLLLATYRPSELAVSGNPLGEARLELQRQKLCSQIPLSPFSRSSFEALVELVLPAHRLPAAFLNRLCAETGGVPFFIAEILTDLRDSGACQQQEGHWRLADPAAPIDLPASVEAVIQRRLERLQEGWRRSLQVASVEGDHFTSTVLALLLNVDELQLEEELEQLATLHHLITFEGEEILGQELASRYRYAHVLFRKVLYDSLQGKRLRLLHRRAGEALESLYGAQTEPVAHQLAHHFELGQMPEKALTYSLQFAQRALQICAWDEADLALRRVRRLADQAADPTSLEREISTGFGEIALGRGHFQEALEHFDHALATLDQTGDNRLLRTHLQHRRARTYEHLGDLEAGFAAVEAGLASAPADSVERAALYVMAAGLHHRQGRHHEALQCAEAALSLPGLPPTHRLRAHAGRLAGLMQAHLGDPTSALAAYEEARTIYSHLQDLRGQCSLLSNMGETYALRAGPGDWSLAQEALAQFRALAERIHDADQVATAAVNQGWLHYLQGHLDQALTELGMAGQIWSRSESKLLSAVVESNIGAVLLAQGEGLAARRRLTAAAQILEGLGAWPHLTETLGYLARAHLAVQDATAARSTSDRAQAQAQESRSALQIAVAQRTAGQVAQAYGDPAAAEGALESSRQLLEQAGQPYELALTRLALASLQVAQGRTPEAAANLHAALSILSSLSARESAQATELLSQLEPAEPSTP